MKRSFYILLISALFQACLEKSDPGFEQENFNSIFDTNEFNTEVYPIDVKQTSDGGYLVLGERRIEDSNFRGVYLLKVNKFGKFESELKMEDNFVNPVGDFLQSGDSFYFFCMDALDLQTRVVQIDQTLASANIKVVGGLTYPAAGSMDGSNAVLLSYDHDDKTMVVSTFNLSSLTAGQSAAFEIGVGDQVEEPIINHFIRTGKRFPFQVGHINGGPYYFNGFYNYTFSLVFTNLNSVSGIVQGQQDDGGMSAIMPLQANKFAASRFNFGDNYFLPNITLETTSISSSTDPALNGFSFPELTPNAPVKIERITIDSKNYLLFASDTKSKQVGMYFYTEDTGEFKSSRYLGFSNPYEISNMTQTADGGLIVVGTTHLAGRFPRIFLSKISKDVLAGQAQ